MKNNQGEYQKELFGEFAQGEKKSGFLTKHKLIQDKFSVTLSADKTIFAAAAVLLAVIIAFCLGAERGKRLSLAGRPKAEEPPSAHQTQPETVQPAAPAVREPPPAKEPTAPKERPPVPDRHLPETSYAIQVATYSRPSSALRLVEELKAKGYRAYLKAGRKDHHIVYVGDYSDKINANSDKMKLRGRFKDCYVITLRKS